jgi:hypothetical protein
MKNTIPVGTFLGRDPRSFPCIATVMAGGKQPTDIISLLKKDKRVALGPERMLLEGKVPLSPYMRSLSVIMIGVGTAHGSLLPPAAISNPDLLQAWSKRNLRDGYVCELLRPDDPYYLATEDIDVGQPHVWCVTEQKFAVESGQQVWPRLAHYSTTNPRLLEVYLRDQSQASGEALISVRELN